ncbi:hypothetical protein K456DRAFT_1911902, partial [Colletotrichum gloeosporioides 23]
VWYDVTKSNAFNLRPYGSAVHKVFSYVTAIKGSLSRFQSRHMPPTEFERIRRSIIIWADQYTYFIDEPDPYRFKSGNAVWWRFCQAAKTFPTQDQVIVTELLGNSAGSIYESEEDVDQRWYAWLLIWHGQVTMHQHPVLAGLHLGLGMILEVCRVEMRDIFTLYYEGEGLDVETFNDRHINLEMCLYENRHDPRQSTEIFRAIVSWSMATILFCLETHLDYVYFWPHAPHIIYMRDATDPFSKAVLKGLVGHGAETTTPFMLLHLLEWKGTTSLRAWPSLVIVLAENFRALTQNEFGDQSARQLANSWAKEHASKVRSRHCYKYEGPAGDVDTKLSCDDGGCPRRNEGREIEIECPDFRENSYHDTTNESQCQMGQLALYLSMWHSGTGNATVAQVWLLDVYTKPLRTARGRGTKWDGHCLFHEKSVKRRQTRLPFLDSRSDFRRLASYNTDGVFDYTINAAVDLLRGFHHGAIRKGRFSNQAIQEWPDISKSMAQLLLRPGMQKSAAEDDHFARFLRHSGNVPGGVTSREKRTLRAWETYGKKCPGRVLHQMIVDSVRWFASQTELPRECFIEDPLSMTCPAVLTASRAKDSVIRRLWKALSKYGRFCLTIVMRAFQ